MSRDEVAPFVGKCVAVSLESGARFQGFLRPAETGYELDAGNSQTAIEKPEDIDSIELLKM
jgi:hypothetical protein